jgi:two-component system response regulator AtoC
MRILIVDDDDVVRERLAAVVATDGYAVDACSDAETALRQVSSTSYDAVLMDVQLPGRSGLDALSEIHTNLPDLPIILITAFASLDGAVDAIRKQAFDYLVKPVAAVDLRLALRRATRLGRLVRENESLRELVGNAKGIEGVVAKSAAMMDVVSLIRRLRENESPVLIRGERGTGKDVVARAIHLEGVRRDGPFVALNCAAVPDTLLESELFGYVRGAFSGADQPKNGLFSRADGGTLFLDEIGEMAPTLQTKLLRVLQDQKVRPLGATEDIECDVRIIASTNRDLDKAIESGQFRRDLFYRLNVIPVRLEPLRARVEDIAPLTDLFCGRFGAERQISATAIIELEAHSWPGNVRELANVIERSLALSDAQILGPADLRIEGREAPLWYPESTQTTTRVLCTDAAERQLSLKEVENLYIDQVLAATGGNKAAAARILGINRTTLYRRS